jgi:hypothetical protein
MDQESYISDYAQYRDKNCPGVAKLKKDQMIIAGIIALLQSTMTAHSTILGAVEDTLHIQNKVRK